MSFDLPLHRMTTEEKLSALEAIWQDLSRTPESIQSPQWHAEVMREREALIRDGQSRFVDWEEAKKNISDKLKSE